MDVDRTRSTSGFRRNCFRCGEPGHLARDCTRTADVRVADVLDEVRLQFEGDLWEELVARVATTLSLPGDLEGPEDFVDSNE